MEYRYKDIYLEKIIEEIFDDMNNENTIYESSTFTLFYRPYEDIKVYIYLEFGKVRLIKIFDEIINKYDLYYDNFEEVYLSKKYKELVVIVDLADNIIDFSFVKDEGRDWNSPKDKIKNYLETKNLQDIYGSLYYNRTSDVNIKKRKIYGQLNNYKFTFDLITRDVKSIQNLETGEFIKISLK